MLWTSRFNRTFVVPIAGFLLMLVWGELIHQFAGPLLPSLFHPEKALADVATIDPDGNGTVQGTLTTCGAGGNFDCLNDAVRSPTNPSITGDYVTFSRNQAANYTMGNIAAVSSVSSITVYLHHVEGSASYQFQVGLYDTNETTQFGTTQNVTIRTAAQWDTVTISGLSLTQTQLDNLRVRLTCTRPGTGNSTCRAHAMYAVVTYTPTNTATVSAVGTQQNVTKNTNQYLGGSFAVVSNSGSSNITSVTINETGSIDASANLKNIKLFYESDVTTPFNCAGETYGGGETQFGSTDTDGFSGANGSSVFTGSSVGISASSALCLYVVADVQSGATPGDTVEIQITNPSTDVVGTGSLTVTPATAVAITGASTVTQAVPSQSGYHWRNDNGSETAATSATGGSENTFYNNFPKATTKRLRVQVTNIGNQTTAAIPYRLEYASKTGFSNCSDISSGWTDVGGAGGDFDMSNSANLTDGNNTTDVGTAGTGAVSNPGGKTFQGTNAAQKDTSSQTAGITLTSSQFTEIEYSIISSGGVADGNAYCFRVTNAGTALTSYVHYPELVIAADIAASASGSHTATASIPSPDNYLGGVFVIADTGGGSNTVTGVTLTEIGTVDAANGLQNVQLRYDYDVSDPFICDDQSYSSGDSLFGTASFNGSNKAVFTGTATVSTSQTMCIYVEYDVTASSTNGNTVQMEITDPSTEIVVTTSTVAPASTIAPSGSTELQKSVIEQADFHWRNNDGNETGATSATNGSENTTLNNMSRNTTFRLRFSVGNTGLATAPEARYRLEWAQKITECSDVASWERMDTAADAWEMVSTANLTQGADTTDVAEANGGVGTPAGTFLTPNNFGQADDVDSTASSTLPANNYLDVEYALRATNSAVEGGTYCFRVSNNGAALDTYTNYAQAVIKLTTDFKIQRGFAIIATSTVTIFAGSEYDAPSSGSAAFIRINNTQLTGAGPNTGNGNNNADDVTAYILSGDITNSVTFVRGPSAGGNSRISWEIVEYTGVAGGENEIIVRDTNNITYGGGTTANSGTISGVVDNNDVVPFITAQYNPSAGRNNFNESLSTAAWNSGTSQVDLTRAVTGGAVITSYAAVEFTGSNWKIQRAEHTFTAASSTESESITSVNSLSRTFLHVQKRSTGNNHADFGHEVWLSSVGAVSFKIDAAAASAAGNTSVAWVIENTQTTGQKMNVSRQSGGFANAGAGPEANNISIGKTLDDLSITSVVVNNRSDDASRQWPEPIMGVRLISATQFELWRSDTTANIVYRGEVVEWPTATTKLEQNYYRIYENNDALKPTTPWPAEVGTLGENTAMSATDNPMAPGEVARLRMTLTVTASTLPANYAAVKLQYASSTGSCGAATNWTDLGDPGSGSAWRGYDTPISDGTSLSIDPPNSGDLLISIATVAGKYKEMNGSGFNPYSAVPGDEIEYDWAVQHNGAADKTSYCFRMTYADGELFSAYNYYPTLRTVGFEPLVRDWRWYDDETSATPSSPLALENVAPNNINNQNALKLRVVVKESSGAAGENNKFALQYSEYSDFSQEVHTLEPIATCVEDSIWCYYDGAGTDNSLIPSAVISSADSCVSGVGNGCGTYNEGTSTVGATLDQIALAATEYEFTILHAGARVNSVYYFRLYDVTTDEPVGVAPTYSYPSLVTEGAALTTTLTGVSSGASIAGIITDVNTTPTTINFGSLPLGSDFEAAQQLSIDTNATEGYMMLLLSDQQLLNSYGDEIPPITGTNAAPESWSTSCPGTETGCFGYHTTDATLSVGTASRFGPIDSYAALETTPQEIMYSSIPNSDVENIIYRINVTTLQPAGDYSATLQYLIVPVH